ncbi:MAG: phosphatidate cytidylyltransferase [Acidimicrobiales bacterium]|nr:MAG: phosphatidate cytidylyltransferase [Acidimicrobiales bacterium]
MEEPGVTNDNEFENEPGASVFGDDADYASGASVFGDEPTSADSVFESPGASVFGDAEAADPVQQSVFGEPAEDASPAVPLAGDDPEPELPSIADLPPAVEQVRLGDDTVALNVEPVESDDLDAWSGLDESAPNWDEGSDDAAWDPGPVPGEPETVRIGETSERFFTFDDESGPSEYVDPGFVDDGGAAGRDLGTAVLTGVALLVVAVVALSLGPAYALAAIVLVVALAAGEFFNALRVAGYQPATLLGLAASVGLPLAVYWRGPQAVALVLALSMMFGLMWFLAGVSTDTPVMNLGVTMLGICYIGVLGSFGAAMLYTGERVADGHGTGLLMAAIIVTIGYDVGAFFAGKSMGHTPLTAVSPNKTVEGLIGGALVSLLASVVVFGLLEFVAPFGDAAYGSFTAALILGVLAAIVAPLGDLAESLMKRDLGIKDMGSILPGHGGVLDRFDAMLFVLPTVYYLAELVLYT